VTMADFVIAVSQYTGVILPRFLRLSMVFFEKSVKKRMSLRGLKARDNLKAVVSGRYFPEIATAASGLAMTSIKHAYNSQMHFATSLARTGSVATSLRSRTVWTSHPQGPMEQMVGMPMRVV